MASVEKKCFNMLKNPELKESSKGFNLKELGLIVSAVLFAALVVVLPLHLLIKKDCDQDNLMGEAALSRDWPCRC